MVRITPTIINERTLNHIQNNIQRMSRLQDQLSTGRKLSTPGENPIDYTLSLGIRSTIMQGRTFSRNVDSVKTSLELTETSLGSVTDVLQTLRTLAVNGANDLDHSARQSIAFEVEEMYQQLLDLANSNFNGQYIFSGGATKEQAFVNHDGTILYQGDDFEKQVLIDQNSKITTNLHGFETFLHTPNQITGSLRIADVTAPLAEQIRLAHSEFPNIPIIPDPVPGTNVDPSPNPDNSPTSLPNNYAHFYIHNEKVRVDLAVDSLMDVKNRINAQVPDVVASINEHNQLVITSKRTDALILKDGEHDIGFSPDKPLQANLLSALGLHRKVLSNRSLAIGYPATDPLVDGTISPTPARAAVTMEDKSFLFAATNTGPDDLVAVTFGDNLALTDIDEDGNTKLLSNGDIDFIDDLEALRFTIDDEVIDLDLRSLTQGIDFDGVPGNEDDVPGSTLGDLLKYINNHPLLDGRVTASINADKFGIEFTATESTENFEIENVRKLFGRDITTNVEIDLAGDYTVTKTKPITKETKLEDLPGALVDATGSLGIRQGTIPPFGTAPGTNEGLIAIQNGERSAAVDLRYAVTVNDVLKAINDSGTGVIASINEWGTGINIENTMQTDGELSIVDMANGTTARDLGFYTPPPPARIQSVAGFNQTDVVGAILPAVSNGKFEFEVRDGQGKVLDSYVIDVDTTDTLGDIVTKIDEADGVAGPGGGLISSNFAGGQLNIVSNYDGHTIFVDPSLDTTGTNAATRFTSLMDLDVITVVTEAASNTFPPYASNQDTASILGADGDSELQEVEEKNIFRTVKNLERGLRDSDSEAIKQSLEDFDIDLDRILNTRTKLGARINRVDATSNRLQIKEDFSRQGLSLVEDADLAALITDLTMTENAFQASLAATSRIVQMSLIDFLR